MDHQEFYSTHGKKQKKRGEKENTTEVVAMLQLWMKKLNKKEEKSMLQPWVSYAKPQWRSLE